MLDAAKAVRETHRTVVEQAVLRGSGVSMLSRLLEQGGTDPESLDREAEILADMHDHAMVELRQLRLALDEAASACMDGRGRRQAASGPA